MQVVKKINNNVAICKDGDGRELIAIGKGIGFPQVPYKLEDISKIHRTFYDISPQYISSIDSIPYEIIEFTVEIVDLAKSVLQYELSPNLVLTLSDHIAFAIERKRKGIQVRMPLIYDIEQMYPSESEIAVKTIERIWKKFCIRLPDDEASGIAMSLVNARAYTDKEKDEKPGMMERLILKEITAIIEIEMGIDVDRSSFNYSRYATHVQYLIKRLKSGKGIDTINHDMYNSIKNKYAETAQCIEKIVESLQKKWGFVITEEEQLYLILHINRVCSREGL